MLITVIIILGSCISKGHVFKFYVKFSKSEAGGRQTRELVNVVETCLPKITIGYYPQIEIPLPRPLFPERASGVGVCEYLARVHEGGLLQFDPRPQQV